MAKSSFASPWLREILDMKEDFTLYPCFDDDDDTDSPEQDSAALFQPVHWGNASSLIEQSRESSTKSTKTLPQTAKKEPAPHGKATETAATQSSPALPTPPATPRAAKLKLPGAFKREIAGKCKHRSGEGQLRCLQKREKTGNQCSRMQYTGKAD